MTAEYSELLNGTKRCSERTILDEGVNPRGEKVHLVRSTDGYEPAGSCARWTDGYFAVWFYSYSTGCRHGQRYKLTDEQAARAHFARLVTP